MGGARCQRRRNRLKSSGPWGLQWSERVGTEIISRNQKRKELRKKKGLCTRCGKNPPRHGKLECECCAVISNKENAKCRKRDEYVDMGATKRTQRRRNRLIAEGLCTRCGKNPSRSCKRECEPCAVISRNEKAAYQLRRKIKLVPKPYPNRIRNWKIK